MYVCEECHDRDMKVIKCKIPFDHHHVHVRSTCDICGRLRVLSECLAYNSGPGVIRRAQCSSVRNVTNETE